jgi:hypothetical protein
MVARINSPAIGNQAECEKKEGFDRRIPLLADQAEALIL